MSGPRTAEESPVTAAAWRALAVLTIVYTLHYVDRSIIGILIEPIKKDLGLTDGQLGFLTGLAYGAVYSVAGLIFGYFIDRTNRRNLLAVLLFCWSGATVLCGLARGFTSLLGARMAVGVAESAAAPTAMSIISDVFPPSRRSTAIGVFWASTTVGLALAATVGGFVADRWGWRAAFFIAGAPGLLMIPILLALVKEPVRGGLDPNADRKAAPPTVSEAWRAMSGNPVYVLAFVGMITNSVASAGLLTWTPSFFVRIHGLTLLEAGLILSAAALIFGSLGTVAGGAIGDRLTRRSGMAGLALTPAASACVAAFGGLGMVLAGPAWLAIAGWMVWEFGFRGYFGPGNNILLSSVEPRMRGAAGSASQSVVNLLGFGLGPTIVGLLSDAIGGPHSLKWAMGAVLVFHLITVGIFLLASRAAARRRRGLQPLTATG